jgi:hypothetical protein
VVEKIVGLRKHYHFGPAKIAMCLARYHDLTISTSGVWRILKRLQLNRLPASQRYRRHSIRWKRYEKQRPGPVAPGGTGGLCRCGVQWAELAERPAVRAQVVDKLPFKVERMSSGGYGAGRDPDGHGGDLYEGYVTLDNGAPVRDKERLIVSPLPHGEYTFEAYTLSGADGSEQDLDAQTVTVR